MDHRGYVACDRVWVAGGADNDSRAGKRLHRVRDINHREGGLIEPGRLHVPRDADDGRPRRLAVQVAAWGGDSDFLADGSLREKLSREGLIDDDGARSVRTVAFLEEPAGAE